MNLRVYKADAGRQVGPETPLQVGHRIKGGISLTVGRRLVKIDLGPYTERVSFSHLGFSGTFEWNSEKGWLANSSLRGMALWHRSREGASQSWHAKIKVCKSR